MLQVSSVTSVNEDLLLFNVRKWSVYRITAGFFVLRVVTPKETITMQMVVNPSNEAEALGDIIEFVDNTDKTMGKW